MQPDRKLAVLDSLLDERGLTGFKVAQGGGDGGESCCGGEEGVK